VNLGTETIGGAAYATPARGPVCFVIMIDDGHGVHYAAVERGTPVYGSDGVKIGKVDEVVDNYREHILDGIVIETPDRELRFVDGPEVARTADRGVTLAITSAEAASLPPPKRAPATFRPNLRAGRIGRLFGGGWKRH
jgi:sporulation protein YlmC with PRC-barrel domain